jgi:hypothetical protein
MLKFFKNIYFWASLEVNIKFFFSLLGMKQRASVLGPWHSWGGQKDPRLHLKTTPPDL